MALAPGRSIQKILSRKSAFFDAEPRGDGGSDIGEAPANAEVEWLTMADDEERDAFACVVCSFECWVVAVICGDDQKVLFG